MQPPQSNIKILVRVIAHPGRTAIPHNVVGIEAAQITPGNGESRVPSIETSKTGGGVEGNKWVDECERIRIGCIHFIVAATGSAFYWMLPTQQMADFMSSVVRIITRSSSDSVNAACTACKTRLRAIRG
jgi:hypothetical protein